MITISTLTRSDLAGLSLLYEEAFEFSGTDTKAVERTWQKIADNKNYIILCAREKDRIVGSVMGVICYELFGKCRPFMVVENVAVSPAHRRKGIARQLMEKLEENARKADCSMILFVSSSHRAGAHKLYESLGYGVDRVNGYRKRLI